MDANSREAGLSDHFDLANGIPVASKTLVPTPRIERVVSEFLGGVSRAIESHLGISLSLALKSASCDASSYPRGQSVAVRCRVFQETLEVILPFELAHELSGNVLKESPSCLLAAPGDKHIAALSYLFAKLITEEECFARYPLYLVAVEPLPEDETEARVSQLVGNVDRLSLEINVSSISHRNLACRVFLSIGTVVSSSIFVEARRLAPDKRTRGAHVAGQTRIRGRLNYNLPIRTLQQAIELKPGDVLTLFANTGWSLRLDKGVVRGGDTTLEVQAGSVPGLLRLQFKENDKRKIGE